MQQALPQDADPPREEAIEVPDGVDPCSGVFFRHTLSPRMLAIVHHILALVKYMSQSSHGIDERLRTSENASSRHFGE